MNEDKETFGEIEITCPNCKTQIRDSFEFTDRGEDTCDKCGCTFSYQREVQVTYSTKLLEGVKK